MIDKEEFKEIREKISEDDKKREEIITLSREIIKLSKVAINSVHRNELDKSKKYIDIMKENISLLKNEPVTTGMKDVAFQEYVEALAFYTFQKESRIISLKECDITEVNYLLGLCDLTGELMRKAVQSVINDDLKLVSKIRDVVSDIYDEFLQMDLPNSELRKKSDSIKWNLHKIEDITYDIKIKKNDFI
jgi:predicted translin family RNA/ssDNA-binding protein